MCPGNEPDERRERGRRGPGLAPHQPDAHGDPHVAYPRTMPGEALGETDTSVSTIDGTARSGWSREPEDGADRA